MSVETALDIPKERKMAVPDLKIFRVGEDYSYFRETLADHYFRAWRGLGLCPSSTEARRRLDNYNDQGILDSSFIVANHNREAIYSLLLTANIRADSLYELLLKIPKYQSFEHHIWKKDEGRIGFSVCFSITAERDFCAKGNCGEEISLSRFNLFNYEAPNGFYKCAYSRLQNVGRKNLLRFYTENVGNPYSLGATGMHEGAYSGLTLAIIKNSRPEDILGGGANTFILLPQDNTQKEINAQVIKNRRGGFVPYEKIGPYLLFRDIWPYLSLAR